MVVAKGPPPPRASSAAPASRSSSEAPMVFGSVPSRPLSSGPLQLRGNIAAGGDEKGLCRHAPGACGLRFVGSRVGYTRLEGGEIDMKRIVAGSSSVTAWMTAGMTGRGMPARRDQVSLWEPDVFPSLGRAHAGSRMRPLFGRPLQGAACRTCGRCNSERAWRDASMYRQERKYAGRPLQQIREALEIKP